MFISFIHYVKGFQTIQDFKFHRGDSVWVYVCNRCGRTREDTLTPLEMVDDNPENAANSGQTLCEKCCLEPDCGDGWPGLTLMELRALWALVRAEQTRELASQAARKAAGDPSLPRTIEEIAEALRACLEESSANKGLNRIGKVA